MGHTYRVNGQSLDRDWAAGKGAGSETPEWSQGLWKATLSVSKLESLIPQRESYGMSRTENGKSLLLIIPYQICTHTDLELGFTLLLIWL